MLTELFDESLDLFFERETNNIINGVSERNLCCRLAMILEPKAIEKELMGYFSDPEYNRKDGKVKTIINDRAEVIRVNCDLLLHSRGINSGRDNLIAIEMKKSERPDSEKVSDRNRLKMLTKPDYSDVVPLEEGVELDHVCGYELGYFLEIDREEREYHLQKFVSGELVESRTESF